MIGAQQIPVLLREREDGKLQIVCGFRRIAALLQLGKATCMAMVRTDLSGKDAAVLSVVENVSRRSYTMIDKANAAYGMKELGWTAEDIAKATGIRCRQVRNYLNMAKFSPDVRQAVQEGRTTGTHAIRLMEFFRAHPTEDEAQWLQWLTTEKPSCKGLKQTLRGKSHCLARRKPWEPLFKVARDDETGNDYIDVRGHRLDTAISLAELDMVMKDVQGLVRLLAILRQEITPQNPASG